MGHGGSVVGVSNQNSPGPSEPALDAAGILAATDALLPDLKRRAERCEELRMLPPESLQEMLEAGLFRTMAPARLGGLGLPLSVLCGSVERVGTVCGSSAWVLAILGIHNWLGALLGDKAQQELFGERGCALFPATFAATGKAIQGDEGMTLTGRWKFASGVDCSDWVAVAAKVQHPTKPAVPDVRCFLLPVSDVRVDDTWFTSGLRGTGNDA